MALGHWLKDYIGPHSGGSGGGSGGGGTGPLIIHVTEEEVKDPQTQETVGYKTDVLASDAYEAWQSGRPIYYSMGVGAEWLVLSVNENFVVAIFTDDNDSVKVNVLNGFLDPDGYLVYSEAIGGGGDS